MNPILKTGLGALLITTALAAGAQEAALTPDEQQAVDRVGRFFDTQFAAEAADSFDADLRPGVQELLGGLRAAVPGLARRWVLELRSQAIDPTLRASALYNRFIAELALWRIEPLSAEDDRRWRAAAEQPGSCLAMSMPTAAQPLRYLQRVPAVERPAALQSERERLARLGGRHDAALHAPLRDWLEESRSAVRTVKALGVAKAPPLPPVLADLWLGEEFVPPGQHSERCSAVLWWVKLQTAPAPEQLAVLRYAMASLATDHYVIEDHSTRTRLLNTGNTSLAQRLQVSGQVELQAEIDTEGRLLKATVGRRSVQVLGLGPDTPPLAFETLLDAAARAQLKAKPPRPPANATFTNGRWSTPFLYELKPL